MLVNPSGKDIFVNEVHLENVPIGMLVTEFPTVTFFKLSQPAAAEELLAIADELEQKYDAKVNAALVRDAAEVYENRKMLKKF